MDSRNVAAIANALAQAEEKLQFVITESAKQARYAVSKAASAVAENIRAISDQLKAHDPAPSSTALQPTRPIPNPAHHATRRAAYPRFHRRGDQLIRIAWSKRGKKEYSHKAPYAALQALATAIAELGKDGRVFTTDHLLPITSGDGAEVPDYQSYVGIAFLKEMALIDQHGRQGYTIPRPAEFGKSVAAAWHKLPEQ